MRGKFGFAVVLLAMAAFLAIESESYGGRRRGHCRSCYSGCGPAGCSTAAPAAHAEASPSDAAHATVPQAAPATTAAAVAPVDAADAVASPSDKRPQPAPSVTSGRPNSNNYYTWRGRRRWYRR